MYDSASRRISDGGGREEKDFNKFYWSNYYLMEKVDIRLPIIPHPVWGR
jgi:hypothetical protein